MTWIFWLQTAISAALGLFAWQAKRMITQYDAALKEKEVLLENDRQAQVAALRKVLADYKTEFELRWGELKGFKEGTSSALHAQLAALKQLNENLRRQDELLAAVARTVIRKFEKSEVVEITNVLLRVQKKG